MGNRQFWCGYLEAGEKSSPVLHDNRLDTGNPDTIYLFNLKRNEVLEYKRAIIEPKLRELGTPEEALEKALKASYLDARSRFAPRSGKEVIAPAREKPTLLSAYEEESALPLMEDLDDELLDEGEWLEEA